MNYEKHFRGIGRPPSTIESFDDEEGVTNLVAKHDEGEVVRVPGAGLDQELISPAVKGLEGIGRGDIVGENATVCSTIESHPK